MRNISFAKKGGYEKQGYRSFSSEWGVRGFPSNRGEEVVKQNGRNSIRDCYDKKRKIGSPKNIEKKICAFFKGL